jgi:glycosyltransferase involved in cell wall biosynthesis
LADLQTHKEIGAGASAALAYEPRAGFASFEDPSLAPCQGKRIGILVVTYNALNTLGPVLKRIPPSVWCNVEEVVVFDDASQDATFELAAGIKASSDQPKLSVLKHPKNLGYGGNQKVGYRYFIDKGFDIVVLLHGDGQYAPEILASLYHPVVTGAADAVFGSRMMPTYGGPLKGGMPFYKFVGNRILTTIENRVLGMNLTEFHSGYRAYNLHALAQLDFSRMTDDFHFDTEIIVKLHHQGFRIREVPIPTFYGWELCNVDGLKYARDVVRAMWRYRQTRRGVRLAPEFAEYFVAAPVKQSKSSPKPGQ